MAGEARGLLIIYRPSQSAVTAKVLRRADLPIQHALPRRDAFTLGYGGKGPWIATPLQSNRLHSVPGILGGIVAIVSKGPEDPARRRTMVHHGHVQLHQPDFPDLALAFKNISLLHMAVRL